MTDASDVGATPSTHCDFPSAKLDTMCLVDNVGSMVGDNFVTNVTIDSTNASLFDGKPQSKANIVNEQVGVKTASTKDKITIDVCNSFDGAT